MTPLFSFHLSFSPPLSYPLTKFNPLLYFLFQSLYSHPYTFFSLSFLIFLYTFFFNSPLSPFISHPLRKFNPLFYFLFFFSLVSTSFSISSLPSSLPLFHPFTKFNPLFYSLAGMLRHFRFSPLQFQEVKNGQSGAGA